MDEDEEQRSISVDDTHVPPWQRQLVWTSDEMGLLAYSILCNYPIGLVVLWRKPDAISVPIDGRQRLSAIHQFYRGTVAIPDLPGVAPEYRNAKYRLQPDDEDTKYHQLSLDDRERFDEYEPQIVEFEDIAEDVAMDIFIRLQGGKSLTKTEVRAALGGRVCDLVTDLTSGTESVDEGEADELEPVSRHEFFRDINVRNVRKAHRNVCDILLHEYLYPGTNKHWSSLEAMYRDKSETLSDSEVSGFKTTLSRFHRASSFKDPEGSGTRLMPQLRSAFLILSAFRAWSELSSVYALPKDFSFEEEFSAFEQLREENSETSPWINFTAALSNAGYAENRIDERHEILMSFVLGRLPSLELKDSSQRVFTEAQKLAIWRRADHQCEFLDEDGLRCSEVFADFREADADHIVRWTDGGPTTLENGRLLCQRHNRGSRTGDS